jgi:isopentenyl diphosphate isomerase/L-lactate dehydrogenase-like FMN-dependent dehydrogenase
VSDPDISVELFGHRLEVPILAAPMAGGAAIGNATAPPDSYRALVAGSRLAGGLGTTGDGPSDTLYEVGAKVIAENVGRGIPFIKPRTDDAEILKRIRLAEEAGAWAVGMDIDAAGAAGMAKRGHPVGPKSPAQLASLVQSTQLPFILKGTMTPADAELAVDAGAAAIVVSNHGGRVLDHTPGTIEVLPGIVDAVGDRITVLADGGIRGGVDVLKFLALGARAVLVGRPLLIAAVGGAAEGVKAVIEDYAEQLRTAMILTGCPDVSAVDQRVLSAPLGRS